MNTLLVMAKAPIVGTVKTRLARDLNDRFDIAADLAAASLLDTLDACARTRNYRRLRIAIAGDLAQARQAHELQSALSAWEVVGQSDGSFAERLAHAHQQVAGPVTQIGMDTPHVSAERLDAITTYLRGSDAVLGPATDGGWWVLGWRSGHHGSILREVPMSSPSTGAMTRNALLQRGLSVQSTVTMTDADHLEDARTIAEIAPATRFAEVLRRLVEVPA